MVVLGDLAPAAPSVTQVRFEGHPRAMCQEEDTVAKQHHGPPVWGVQRVRQILRLGGPLEVCCPKKEGAKQPAVWLA